MKNEEWEGKGMTEIWEMAEPAVKQLLVSDEGQLYEVLGIRAKALTQDVSKSASFEPDVVYDVAEMGALDDVRDFGRRLFKRWSQAAYDLVCGKETDNEEDRKKLRDAFGLGNVTVGAVLTGLLVSSLGLAPAIAAVVAAIVVKLFFHPAYKEFCETWKKRVRTG